VVTAAATYSSELAIQRLLDQIPIAAKMGYW